MICNTCNDTGSYRKPYHANATPHDLFEDLFGNIFGAWGTVPCPHCAKGGQERRDREQRVQARKAEERRRAQEAETYRLQAEAKWRRDIWEVIQGLIAPCQEALSFGNLDCLDHEHKRNRLTRLRNKVQLAEEWVSNDEPEMPNEGTQRSMPHHDSCKVKTTSLDDFAEDWALAEALDVPDDVPVKFVSLDDREERLKWVREKVPFALKAHEDYYHALDNYPVLYQIKDILPSLHMYVFNDLPAYDQHDFRINHDYERLSSLVEVYKSGEK